MGVFGRPVAASVVIVSGRFQVGVAPDALHANQTSFEGEGKVISSRLRGQERLPFRELAVVLCWADVDLKVA